MTDEDFLGLLADVGALRQGQLVALDAAIRTRLDGGGQPAGPRKPAPEASVEAAAAAEPAAGCASIADIEARFAAAPSCPHCQSTAIGKWGPANGMRRYQCKACAVTFNALTGTPLAQLHKRELWIGHAQALVDGISLR